MGIVRGDVGGCVVAGVRAEGGGGAVKGGLAVVGWVGGEG